MCISKCSAMYKLHLYTSYVFTLTNVKICEKLKPLGCFVYAEFFEDTTNRHAQLELYRFTSPASVFALCVTITALQKSLCYILTNSRLLNNGLYE